jgi:NTE family protein
VIKTVWEHQPAPTHVGIVLGGGAARGFAHIGVLQTLVSANIPIHFVTGVSAGAIVGGLFAAGLHPDTLAEKAPELKWSTVSTLSLPSFQLSASSLAGLSLPLGMLDLEKMISYVDELMGGARTFEELPYPFAALAYDIVNNELVVMNTGLVAPAIRASCSIPGIFTPYRRNDRLLIDGGAINNLPTDIVRQMGAQYVIAVDLLPAVEAEQEPRNALEIGMTALYAMIRVTQVIGPQPHCTITPDIGHIGLSNLDAVAELIEAGRVAASAVLPQLRADLGIVSLASVGPSKDGDGQPVQILRV